MSKHLPVVRLLYWLPDTERIIASAAKATLSPRDFTEIAENYTVETVEAWMQELMSRGHGSPLEHSIYIFEVVCSRVCSHQLIRHRHASYSQLSQRYSDKYLRGLIEKASKILGLESSGDFKENARVLRKFIDSINDFNVLLDVSSEAFIIPPIAVLNRDEKILKWLVESVGSYYEALSNGMSYEDARYLLPQAVKTRIIVSMNARELLEVFLPLRMCTRAQWEIRQIAWGLWRQLVNIHPSLFKYTGPRCILLENRTRSTPCTLEEYLVGKCSFTIERCPEKQPREQISSCLSRSKY